MNSLSFILGVEEKTKPKIGTEPNYPKPEPDQHLQITKWFL